MRLQYQLKDMKIGIDKIGFYIPSYFIKLEDLAIKRGVDPNKYITGLGQEEMAIIENSQDIISLAGNAAISILNDEDLKEIDLVLFATESSIDQSKANGIFLKELLKINSNSRFIELKQACFSSTMALEIARNYIALNEDKKVLILTSDLAKYEMFSSAEATQGVGSIAIIVSKDPKIATISSNSSYISEDVMDFYRPNYSNTPIVDGKLSIDTYINFFQKTFSDYITKNKISSKDFAAICCHIPYGKLGQKAISSLIEDEHILKRYEISKTYNKKIGNIYTGSLYLSFLSLIENDDTLKANDMIGMFAYGSGAVGQFFSLELVSGFKNHLNSIKHQKLLNNRIKLSIDEYEKLYLEGEDKYIDKNKHQIYFDGIENHKRIYKIK